MAIWRITIEKYLAMAGEYWTNVYHADVAGGTEAQNVANLLVTMEQQFHSTAVLFTKARVDDNTPNTDVYDTFAINQFGLGNASADLMPLFVVMRVDINTVGAGRPSRKYYRGGLNESQVNGMTIAQAVVDYYRTTMEPVMLGNGLVDVDGQAFSSVEPSPITGMRQLRRGSKKKATP
jgi:hypothetical protein